MNVSQLKYIVSVDNERNFARAARACHVAQPTLSKEIQKLESKLDVMIFDRSRTPVIPTARGVKLIAQARQVLMEIDRFECLAMNQERELTGSLNLGVCPTVAPYLLPLFLPQFSEQHPKLQIILKEMPLSSLQQALVSETLDAAICVKQECAKQLYQLDLGKEPYLAYVSERNPLYQQRSISFEQAIANGLQIASDLIDQIQFGANNEQHVRFRDTANLILEFGSLETLRRFVELGDGITLIPSLASLYMGERRKRHLREIESPQLHRNLVLSTRRGFHKREILDHLRSAIKNVMHDARQSTYPLVGELFTPNQSNKTLSFDV